MVKYNLILDIERRSIYGIREETRDNITVIPLYIVIKTLNKDQCQRSIESTIDEWHETSAKLCVKLVLMPQGIQMLKKTELRYNIPFFTTSGKSISKRKYIS